MVQDFEGVVKSKTGANSISKCICQRRKRNILCRNCGNIMFGRIRSQCPEHKMVMFLFDICSCNKCKAIDYMLLEFDSE